MSHREAPTNDAATTGGAGRIAAAMAAGLASLFLLGLHQPQNAEALHQAEWVDAGAAAPATVDFSDVAAGAGAVIAVGVRGGASAGDEAAIYRRAAGVWVTDSVTGLPTGAHTISPTKVALSADAAWAVGRYTNSVGTVQPLVLRFAGGAAALAAGQPGQWAAISAGSLPAGLTNPTSVALRGTRGLIGGEGGGLYPVNDAGPAVGAAITSGQPPTSRVNGIAIYSGAAAGGVQLEAFAVTNMPAGGSSRVFRVQVNDDPQLSLATAMLTTTGDADLIGVGATASDTALAPEGGSGGSTAPGLWTPTGVSTWGRSTAAAFTNVSLVHDVSLIDSGSGIVEAVAGGLAGAGAVWRRVSGGVWTRDDIASGSLRGVAALGTRDIWAAGDDGAILHYTPVADPPPPPEPPDTSILSGPVGVTGKSQPTFTFASDPVGATFECNLDGAGWSPCASPATVGPLGEGGHTFQVRAVGDGGPDPSPASREFNVVFGPPPDEPYEPPCVERIPDRLTDNVRVRLFRLDRARPSRRGSRASGLARYRIRITFRLRYRARVRVVAKRRGRVVAKTRRRILEPGRRRVVMRVRETPSRIRLVVDPVTKCKP